MKKAEVVIEPHSGIDKSFEFTIINALSVKVDYDDVNHMEVDAAVEHLKELIEKHWNDKDFQQKYYEKVVRNWSQNIDGIQSDYEGNYSEYMSDHGFNE